MRGSNPIRPPLQHDGSELDVVGMFATLQGEGPRAGEPAVFVRLGGCNLACDFCDTEFETFNPLAVDNIIGEAERLAGAQCSLVVITGGEPLRQNIIPLSEALLAQGFTVQIETNGTLMRPLPKEVEIVCSPKNTGQGYMPLRDDVLARARALKFIVSASHPLYDDIGQVGQDRYHTPVYIQPMDEYDIGKNAANLAHAAQLAMRHGAKLSLQLHKIVGLR